MLKTTASFLELFAHGLVLGPLQGRPIFLLKDKSGNETLPVWINSIEAGLAAGDGSTRKVSNPHAATLRIFKELGYVLEECRFVDVQANQQFVDLVLSSPSGSKTVRCRAEDCMSLCLISGTKFFADLEFLEKSRRMNVEMMELGLHLDLNKNTRRDGQLLI